MTRDEDLAPDYELPPWHLQSPPTAAEDGPVNWYSVHPDGPDPAAAPLLPPPARGRLLRRRPTYILLVVLAVLVACAPSRT
ncbi:hypothetical protein [Streptomyces griseorubiginosus]|uniref:hypothetical protein n=1 Tax=Streptomyces griseorubiginosus TaxID=67304 RepID=UPI0036EC6D42